MGKAANLDFLEAAQSPRPCSPHSPPRESETPICLLGFQHTVRQVIRRERLGERGWGCTGERKGEAEKKKHQVRDSSTETHGEGKQRQTRGKRNQGDRERRETERDKARREGERQTDG